MYYFLMQWGNYLLKKSVKLIEPAVDLFYVFDYIATAFIAQNMNDDTEHTDIRDVRRTMDRTMRHYGLFTQTPELDQETNQSEASNPLLSYALNTFIEFRRKITETNQQLSQHYNASDYHLMCPMLLDFPLIPVRFNGRLYDYDKLMKLAHHGMITDPSTRETIKLSPHVIQPDYDAQARMDILLSEKKQNLKPSS